MKYGIQVKANGVWNWIRIDLPDRTLVTVFESCETAFDVMKALVKLDMFAEDELCIAPCKDEVAP